MSLSVGVSPWSVAVTDDAKGVLTVCDDELRLCLDRSSDSDSQLELNRSLTDLIESITCKDDSGDEILPTLTCGREVVSDIVERILDRVEETAASAPRRPSAELTDAREIDCEGSRDKGKSHHRKAGTQKKAVRRKRDRSGHERKKSRRRSTSDSSTSSACSDVSRKHRGKRKHHRRREGEAPSPRVNPIFLWVKQDDTRIVEVLCEDYDKRNRLRLTKTAHGWRAVPRTERLDSTLSRSSLDLPPSPECPLPLVKTEPGLPAKTKDRKTKRCVSRKKSKRCDKGKERGFKNTLDNYKYVDVVNNNNNSINNNNEIKTECKLEPQPCLSEPRLRSFGYKKACHEGLTENKKKKVKDNKRIDDIDVYTFVSTPKTDSDVYEFDYVNEAYEHSDSGSELKQKVDLKIKQEPEPLETNLNDCADITDIKSEPSKEECKLEKSSEPTSEIKPLLESNECVNMDVDSVETPQNDFSDNKSPDISNQIQDMPMEVDTSEKKEQAQILGTPLEEGEEINLQEENVENVHQAADVPLPETVTTNCVDKPSCESNVQNQFSDTSTAENIELSNEQNNILCEKSTEVIDAISNVQDKSLSDKFTGDNNVQPNDQNNSISNTSIKENNAPDPKPVEGKGESKKEDIHSSFETEEEEEDDDDPQNAVELPELHLQTPEHSPHPVPEPSTAEPETSLTALPLQPDTSLDSDTLHLPDTTTKSDNSLLISTDISLGQKLSIKSQPDISMGSTLLSSTLHSTSKPLQSSNILTSSDSEMKTASLLHQTEIERQITADLDEDHLLAIEEILQGEECVEDFDDDDLPDDYTSDESPVNLVIDLKAKDQVDNTGIPLSLRTDDFLEIFPSSLSSKDHAEILPVVTSPAKNPVPVEKPIPPAHQQSKTKFLESILSHPKRSHKDERKKSDSSDQQEPLYLGVSRKSASPTVSSSDGRKFSSPELEPKPKRLKVEDITLKNILNRNKETSYSKSKTTKSKDNDDTQQTADSTTKSRLLELLTNENDEHISKMDPLTQLKEVLSDPDLNVPDPLLVPRARLPALVANPAKEIPRLLAMKSENLTYPKLLTDPDLLVVSLSHLQTLLQAAGKDEEMLKYQQHAQLLQQQMKQEQSTLDAATATALNQMMWLPYLSQLEAAAVACGNTQDFMTMLNMVFPSGAYSQMNPYMMSSTSPGINAYDYKSQLEFQQAFALWNEAMMQAATNQFAAQSLGTTNNNISSKLYQSYQDAAKYSSKHAHANSKSQESKHAAARTSPITLNYPQNKYRASQYPYTSMFSIPTSTPTTSIASATSYRTTSSTQSQQSYQGRQRGYNYSNYAGITRTTPSANISRVDTPTISAITTSDLYKSQQRHATSSTSSSNSSCRSLMNILSKPPSKQSEVKHHVSKAYPTSTTMLPKETTLMMAPAEPPKLKVKQPQHLVDPHSRPKLLNFDEHGEVGSTTGSLTPQVDESHSNLWHPLFSSHQQKSSYSSPWQWTTPVTVSGE